MSEQAVPQAQFVASSLVPAREQGQWAIIIRQLRRNRAAILGLVVIIIEVFVTLAAPWVAPYDPLDQSVREALKPPSPQHLMGTDEVGRDLLSRLIYGGRISLRVGLIAASIAGIVGVFLGTVAGFRGGWLDEVLMRLIDILLAFPGMLLALTIIAVLGPGLFNVMIAVGIGSIPSFTRVARGSTLAVREQDYVLSARVIGCTDARIIFRYVVPNVLPAVIVLTTLRVATAILTAAGLSFLGLGAQPPTPEWGAILSSARDYLRRAWWFMTFPGLAIMITVLSINMFGDGLRDALDPKLRR